MRLIHLADFQKYRCGTSSRTGPPCSRGSGRPPYSHTTHALPSMTSWIGRFVVYPVVECAITKRASSLGPAVSRSTSMLTPENVTSDFDHVVTQWMSPEYDAPGSVWICSQLHVVGRSTSPSTVSVHPLVSS